MWELQETESLKYTTSWWGCATIWDEHKNFAQNLHVTFNLRPKPQKSLQVWSEEENKIQENFFEKFKEMIFEAFMKERLERLVFLKVCQILVKWRGTNQIFTLRKKGFENWLPTHYYAQLQAKKPITFPSFWSIHIFKYFIVSD